MFKFLLWCLNHFCSTQRNSHLLCSNRKGYVRVSHHMEAMDCALYNCWVCFIKCSILRSPQLCLPFPVAIQPELTSCVIQRFLCSKMKIILLLSCCNLLVYQQSILRQQWCKDSKMYYEKILCLWNYDYNNNKNKPMDCK